MQALSRAGLLQAVMEAVQEEDESSRPTTPIPPQVEPAAATAAADIHLPDDEANAAPTSSSSAATSMVTITTPSAAIPSLPAAMMVMDPPPRAPPTPPPAPARSPSPIEVLHRTPPPIGSWPQPVMVTALTIQSLPHGDGIIVTGQVHCQLTLHPIVVFRATSNAWDSWDDTMAQDVHAVASTDAHAVYSFRAQLMGHQPPCHLAMAVRIEQSDQEDVWESNHGRNFNVHVPAPDPPPPPHIPWAPSSSPTPSALPPAAQLIEPDHRTQPSPTPSDVSELSTEPSTAVTTPPTSDLGSHNNKGKGRAIPSTSTSTSTSKSASNSTSTTASAPAVPSATPQIVLTRTESDQFAMGTTEFEDATIPGTPPPAILDPPPWPASLAESPSSRPRPTSEASSHASFRTAASVGGGGRTMAVIKSSPHRRSVSGTTVVPMSGAPASPAANAGPWQRNVRQLDTDVGLVRSASQRVTVRRAPSTSSTRQVPSATTTPAPSRPLSMVESLPHLSLEASLPKARSVADTLRDDAALVSSLPKAPMRAVTVTASAPVDHELIRRPSSVHYAASTPTSAPVPIKAIPPTLLSTATSSSQSSPPQSEVADVARSHSISGRSFANEPFTWPRSAANAASSSNHDEVEEIIGTSSEVALSRRVSYASLPAARPRPRHLPQAQAPEQTPSTIITSSSRPSSSFDQDAGVPSRRYASVYNGGGTDTMSQVLGPGSDMVPRSAMSLPVGAYRPSRDPARVSYGVKTLEPMPPTMGAVAIATNAARSLNRSALPSFLSSSTARREAAAAVASAGYDVDLPPHLIAKLVTRDAVRYTPVAKPPQKLRSDEILVQVFACAIDVWDRARVRTLVERGDGFGYIPGRSFCGKALECGIDVSRIRRGDFVYGLQDLRLVRGYKSYTRLGQSSSMTDTFAALAVECYGRNVDRQSRFGSVGAQRHVDD